MSAGGRCSTQRSASSPRASKSCYDVSAPNWDPILDEVEGLDIARGIGGLPGFRSAPIGTPPRTNSARNIKVYGASARGPYWVPFHTILAAMLRL